MSHRQRLRRVGILCCHCLRNLAFYLAWYETGKPNEHEQFWVNINGKFFDIAVLEWCKLFGDTRGKHYFGKVISDVPAFNTQLLASLDLSAEEFDEYINQVKLYRDKFVAHLDELNIMHFPTLSIARNSTAFLYEYLLAHEGEGNVFHDAPVSAETFYQKCFAESMTKYQQSVA